MTLKKGHNVHSRVYPVVGTKTKKENAADAVLDYRLIVFNAVVYIFRSLGNMLSNN